MLERLVAGILIIGAILWGASLVAAPEDVEESKGDGDDAPESFAGDEGVAEAGEPLPGEEEPEASVDEGEAQAATEPTVGHDRKGKRGPG